MCIFKISWKSRSPRGCISKLALAKPSALFFRYSLWGCIDKMVICSFRHQPLKIYPEICSQENLGCSTKQKIFVVSFCLFTFPGSVGHFILVSQDTRGELCQVLCCLFPREGNRSLQSLCLCLRAGVSEQTSSRCLLGLFALVLGFAGCLL